MIFLLFLWQEGRIIGRNQAAMLKLLQEIGDGCEKHYRLQLQAGFMSSANGVLSGVPE